MIRILAGETTPDSGWILLGEQPWRPAEERSRVAVVHQESQLFPNLTVGENLLVGRESSDLIKPVLGEREIEMLRSLGIVDYRDTELGSCPLLVQQLCEICRALVMDANIFLFDEPNSALTGADSQHLFDHMHLLKGSGKIVLLVTHRLQELAQHADRVAIIRDGVNVLSIERQDLTEERIAENLVVKLEGQTESKRVARSTEYKPGVRFANWTHAQGRFRNLDLEVRMGEVLAVVGVEGSGAREFVRSVCDVERANGQVSLEGGPTQRLVPAETAYLPASRQASLFHHFSVMQNVISRLGHPHIAQKSGWLLRREAVRVSREAIARFSIRTESPRQPISALSGGNQQKVAVASAIAKNPRILVLEEPTRGVDLQSKTDIYGIIRQFAAEGKIVITFCTEVPEVYDLADRVTVVANGLMSAPVDVHTFENLELLATWIARVESQGVSRASPAVV